ncbi:MAG: MarR family transcriptional regulator [Limnohabitans sp.]|nr:MarR family transcriptional regulator [Limnohabitans sp.]
MEKLEEIIFYTLEKSIKKYRQFAQNKIDKNGFDITIDQWLVLKTIQESDEISQQKIAEMVFKDLASVTRIIELLVKKNYLIRNINEQDRRRFKLDITNDGKKVIEDIYPLVISNRKQALNDISTDEIVKLKHQLEKIINNCK